MNVDMNQKFSKQPVTIGGFRDSRLSGVLFLGDLESKRVSVFGDVCIRIKRD